MLRLNMAIPPTTSSPSNLGLIGGDAAGYPNGRRVFDDVVTIEIRAIAGVTLPLVDSSYTPDGAAAVVTDGLTSSATDTTAERDRDAPSHVPVPRCSPWRVLDRLGSRARHDHPPVRAFHLRVRSHRRAPHRRDRSHRRVPVRLVSMAVRCPAPYWTSGERRELSSSMPTRRFSGGEIEICPTGRLAEREHNIVRERRTPSGSVYAAVFPALIEGYYTVLTEDLEPSYEVSVVGGMVSEIDCSAGGEA